MTTKQWEDLAKRASNASLRSSKYEPNVYLNNDHRAKQVGTNRMIIDGDTHFGHQSCAKALDALKGK